MLQVLKQIRSMRVFIFIGLLSFMAITPLCTHAQIKDEQVLEDYRKPLPDFEEPPEEEFMEKTKIFSEIPEGDEGLGYSIRLPKSWEKSSEMGLSNFSLSDKVFGEIARYYGPVSPVSPRARVNIVAVELEYQLTAEQWLLQYMISNGYPIQGIRTYDDNKVEAVYVVIERDVSYAVRTAAQINGNRLIMAQFYLPIEIFKEGRGIQQKVLSTFKLLNHGNEIPEKMVDYQFLDIAQMKYPESWVLRAPPLRSIDRMSAKILNIAAMPEDSKKAYLNGRIEVGLVSYFVAKDLEEEAEDFKEKFKSEGFLLKDKVSVPWDAEFHETFEFADVEAFNAVNAESDLISYEFWTVVGLAGDYYYFASLLTPSRDQDYFIWSRNTQTFKLFLENIKPLEPKFVDE